jgi:hypothetical protein
MLAGVRADGEGEFRLGAGDGMLAAAGEFEEPAGQPGAAFEHEQVPGAVRLFEFPGLRRARLLDQGLHSPGLSRERAGTRDEDAAAACQRGPVPAGEHRDFSAGGVAQQGQRARSLVEVVGERDVQAIAGGEVAGAVEDRRQVAVGAVLGDEADGQARRDGDWGLYAGRRRGRTPWG